MRRNITLRYFTPAFILVGIIWITFITLVNVVVVGYESVVITSTDFSSTAKAWYENFMLRSLWFVPAWSCNATVINVNDGNPSLPILVLTKGMQPYSQLFAGYNLVSFIDERDNIPVDGMEYADYSLNSCTILKLQLSQWMSSAGTTQVMTLFV